jgi:hypothetical protein
MSLIFPLSLASFADLIGVSQVKWNPKDNRELSGMGSGQILGADLAPQLWTGDLTLAEKEHADARKIEAKLNAVIRSMGSFYLYDPRTAYPYADRDGSTLGSSTVKVKAKADGKSLSLKGLPAGYVLTEGDYLAFDYNFSTRRWFGEVAEGVTADSSGDTATFEVSPFLPLEDVTGLVVTLVKPAMVCKIVPGSLSVQSTGNSVTTQIGFSVIQSRAPGRPTYLPENALASVNYLYSTPKTWNATRTFSRDSVGTYPDADGVLQTAAIDAIRLAYDADGVALGALLEVTRTNLVRQSSDLSASPWTNQTVGSGSVTVTANAATAPNGLTEATRLQFSACAAGDTAARAQSLSVTAGTTRAPSIWLKAAAATDVWMRQGNVSLQQIIIGTDWQRFEPTPGAASPTSINFQILCNDGSNASDAKDIYAWGAQFEQDAAAASSYIATGASSALRAADVETISPTDQTSSFDWYALYDDDSTGKITSGVTGDFEVDPADLTRPNVKLIWAEAAA